MRYLTTLILLSSLFFGSCNSDSNSEIDLEKNINNTNQLAVTMLTDEEISDLLFLREEEKLARDVYLFSYDLYNLQIFKNISNSESTHMNSVLNLLNTYNLEDPILNEIGKFKNVDLQEIYNVLIQQSSISLLEALKAGNIIEDLDINDIAKNELRTVKSDLLAVYGALKCGSRNHLRNFNSQLISNNGTYVAQYISEEDFNDIVTTSNEKCGSN